MLRCVRPDKAHSERGGINGGGGKKMHSIFPHYFQSFYSTANDFCPQQLQIRLTERGSGCIGLGLNGLNAHRHTNMRAYFVAGMHTHTYTHAADTHMY